MGGISSVYIPPKWTLFTNGFVWALDYIIVENAQHSIPYQEAPIAPSAKLDYLQTIKPFHSNSKKIMKSEVTYSDSAGKVKKCTKNDGLSLFDQGVDMRPMDESHPSDQFVSIIDVGDHLLPEIVNWPLLYCFYIH